MTYSVINNKFQRVPGQDPDWKPYLLLILAAAMGVVYLVVQLAKLITLFR